MSITEQMASMVTAANTLTQQVTDQINSINQRVDQFETEARNIANQATSQMYRSKIGTNQFPQVNITPSPSDDAGQLVQAAFDAGNKYVNVHWHADGQDRHWNTVVNMPVGGTLAISGPISDVSTLGGNVRSDRACYAKGGYGGISELGSPMIFRNLDPSSSTYPQSVYSKVMDETVLINMYGNNTLIFGEGAYVHDTGGTVPNYYGNALVRINSYYYDMPCYVGGGGHHANFYLGAPLINNCQGNAVCEVRIMMATFTKLSSDGPALTVDKGYKRLLDKGVSGVTSALLNKQLWEFTEAEAGLNDNDPQILGHNWSWHLMQRGIEAETDRPRLISAITFSHVTGYTMVQIGGQSDTAFGELSMAGLSKIAGKKIYIGNNE